MAYTSEQLTALEQALARGERRVTLGDKTVEYRSVDELKAAIAEVRGALAAAQGVRTRQIRLTTSKAT
jgi:multidrug resistance efflux pump